MSSTARTPNFVEGLSAQSSITGLNEYVTSTNGALDVNASITPPALQNVNLTEIDGSPITLGQKTMAASLPVVIASDQGAVTVQAHNLDIRDLVFATDKVDASGSAVSISNGGGVAAVNIQDGGNTITVDGTVTANIATPSTLVAFSTDIPTAGSRVQLASNSVVGVVIQAKSTNTGVVYVGGATVSSTVFGAELQPGQSVGLAIDNTNKIYVDTATNGNDVSVLGS